MDKSMKLALLTSKNLIITDSPPRTILYTLPLIEFLSLTLVSYSVGVNYCLTVSKNNLNFYICLLYNKFIT